MCIRDRCGECASPAFIVFVVSRCVVWRRNHHRQHAAPTVGRRVAKRAAQLFQRLDDGLAQFGARLCLPCVMTGAANDRKCPFASIFRLAPQLAHVLGARTLR
eukprot:TRINITY_DN2930_c1_g2_i1.p2 TRINITY_DN2930_c1_g2~~TRINITY_DN2930_c1_g2_i1.p2  ORF type:complete len:103 (-),score=12.62 TRINITY_DN2930_c1_g2_i1:3-311(-)